MKNIKKLLFLMVMAGILVLAAACGGSKESSSKGGSEEEGSSDDKQVTINLYTSESQDLVGEMMNEFTKKHPNIKIDIFRTGTEELITKMEAERQAGGIAADMVWFADIDYFNTLDEEGLLLEYLSPNAENIDEKFAYNGGKYYEVRQIFNVIAYNTAQVSEPLTSWKDLHRDDLKGKVAMASPDYSGAAFLTLSTIVDYDDLGWDFYTGLNDNDVKFEQGNGALASKIASGEYHAVSVVDFMALKAKNDGAPVEVVWPEEGVAMIPTPVGILKDSEVAEEAKKVIDFLLSEECQELFKEQGYIPVNPNVGVPENAPNVEDIKTLPLDLEFLKQNREELKSEFHKIFTSK